MREAQWGSMWFGQEGDEAGSAGLGRCSFGPRQEEVGGGCEQNRALWGNGEGTSLGKRVGALPP